VGELAALAVEELELGQRGALDFLALGFSATDYVGHGYGPLSQEQLDNLHRLDRVLGELFDHLDETVGEGRWIVGFSGDHGVMTIPEVLGAEGEAGRRVIQGERMQLAQRAVQDAAAEVGQELDSLPPVLARLLEERGLAAAAYTHRELAAGMPADSFAVLYRNSHYPGRGHGWFSRFGVEVRFDYNELVSFPTGTTHGSPYWYDRHVPFILMGPGIEPGVSDLPVYTVDLAPTLAGLAGVPVPVDLDGGVVWR
jgi:arylsulfatase A-like enzyme